MGHKGDTACRTRCRGAAKADTRRTQGGQMAGSCRIRFGGAAAADTRRMNGGHMSDKVSRHGQDTGRTHCGQTRGTRPRHIAVSLFLLRENPSGLASGLCPLLACCGAGPWHHQTTFFPPLCHQHHLYCMPPSVSLACISASEFGFCKRALWLKTCVFARQSSTVALPFCGRSLVFKWHGGTCAWLMGTNHFVAVIGGDFWLYNVGCG